MTSVEFERHFSVLSSQPVEDIMVGLAFGKLGQQTVDCWKIEICVGVVLVGKNGWKHCFIRWVPTNFRP